MKQNYRVSLAFASYSDADLNAFAILVIVCLTGNAAFPALPLTLEGLTALQTAFENAMNASSQGGTQQTAAKNEARTELLDGLRQIAGYVQIVAGQILSTLLSSGFNAMNTNRAQAPLDQPVIAKLENYGTTQVLMRVLVVDNAKAYQVQISTGTNPWQDALYSTQARRIVIPNLTPGAIYNVRVRALGGSTGYSDWSAPVPIMST